MEKEQKSCNCSVAPKLIFPCSGASDTGAISDRTARKLSTEGVGKMYCLAGIGGGVGGIIANTEAAAKILAIDGCPTDCAKKTLEKAGFKDFEHLRVTDLGMEKGKSPVTEERIAEVANQAKPLLG